MLVADRDREDSGRNLPPAPAGTPAQEGTPAPDALRRALAELPPVDILVERLAPEAEAAGVPRALLLAWIREGVQEARDTLRGAKEAAAPIAPRTREAWLRLLEDSIRERLLERRTSGLRRVVNATGVLLHTNLGRAPLPAAAQRALLEASAGYSNLEVDLDSGRRRSRLDPIRRLLPLITGAEAGFAVHNNAAAVNLVLTALAFGREVVVSRGHLVEIGGSFRLPEIMEASGARLVEVGSTNRTRLSDYARVIGPQTALLLKVHPSNFRMIGFTEEVPTGDLADLARQHGIPLLHDVGSGALNQHGPLAFDEPRVQEALEAGADLVCFSGDKLLGGPQAGILVGRKEWIDRLSRHPVARVVRLDKWTLAALEATLEAYLDPARLTSRIPLLAMLSRSEEELQGSAERLADALRGRCEADWSFTVVETLSQVGGGTLPGLDLPSRAVSLSSPGRDVDAIGQALRRAVPPVFGRIEKGRFLLDLRALLPEDEALLVEAASVLNGIPRVMP